jgi:hypothetical protein
VLVYQRPIDAMVDVTNDLGVAVLQVRYVHFVTSSIVCCTETHKTRSSYRIPRLTSRNTDIQSSVRLIYFLFLFTNSKFVCLYVTVQRVVLQLCSKLETHIQFSLST